MTGDAVKLSDGQRAFVGAKHYRGEIPGKFIPSEHKLRSGGAGKAEAVKSESAGNKTSKKSD